LRGETAACEVSYRFCANETAVAGSLPDQGVVSQNLRGWGAAVKIEGVEK
jgi:hypothetical protein